MHTIFTQVFFNDTTSGQNLAGGFSRDTATDVVYSDSLVITTTPGNLSYGAITTPHRVILKLISGDPLTISFDAGTTEPLELVVENDFIVLRINPSDIPTIRLVSTGTSNIIAIIEPA
jgi:hypothetical protein